MFTNKKIIILISSFLIILITSFTYVKFNGLRGYISGNLIKISRFISPTFFKYWIDNNKSVCVIGEYDNCLEFVTPLEAHKFIRKKEQIIESLRAKTGEIEFVKNSRFEKYNLKNKKILFKKFQSKNLSISKHPGAKGNTYIEYFNNNIILAMANGFFSFVNFNDLEDEKFKSYMISSNFKKIVKYDNFYLSSGYGIKDIYIHDNKIYVSYSNEKKIDCFNTAIMVAEFNFSYLDFKKFYEPELCVKKKNVYGEFSMFHSGGRIFGYDKEHLIFTSGEYRYRTLAQMNDNDLGKILLISIKDNNAKIISLGHRNPQGLYYDKENNILFSTEHGPRGGDEVNIMTNPLKKIRNYGWPISSYGEKYEGSGIGKKDYAKSHKEFGFEEPLVFFTPSIGISEIIKIDNKFIGNNDDIHLLFGSMGRKSEDRKGSQSLHYLILSDDLRIKFKKIIKINERVRDIFYVKDKNVILLYLETTGSLAVISII
mgnify:CR=1 FL=1|tara:strand:+ start:463 stop:1914 length:1452 start_codon:yes stop_codon:yes gene_type:complete